MIKVCAMWSNGFLQPVELSLRRTVRTGRLLRKVLFCLTGGLIIYPGISAAQPLLLMILAGIGLIESTTRRDIPERIVFGRTNDWRADFGHNRVLPVRLVRGWLTPNGGMAGLTLSFEERGRLHVLLISKHFEASVWRRLLVRLRMPA